MPREAKLNRDIWERIETAVRDLASREGELYVVTGAAFQGQNLQAIGPDGVCLRARGKMWWTAGTSFAAKLPSSTSGGR